MKLTDSFDDVIVLNGKEIPIDVSFDVVLRAFELGEDKAFQDVEKWDIMAEMFTSNDEDYEQMEPHEKIIFVQAVLENFIKEDEEQEEKQQGSSYQEKYYDFVQDADFIYASFLFDYNIDLIEQQGRLHWRKFQALLNGLSEKTKFREVVGIRTQKITRDMSRKQVENLRRLKRVYALKAKTAEEVAAQIQAMDSKANSVAGKLRQKGGA
ncbi:Gp15 family bacteriophage protein [Bacillus sp. CLL-7-23]|uniref:Gp15 family bacteriophage protein n=1 Tax=Bacillus changyiensis TaxID=3004103 RepID=A0ABT4X903_9BACI|nr:Gp15 family bacteriophage protein [Bacillus changyiensis]MDA1477265.1 Gp15 family bacteriophage protein [Bacillus changyiensis]MDA7028527.1 Gp15 family bacteriophage protein [Bacillus changyiensis]